MIDYACMGDKRALWMWDAYIYTGCCVKTVTFTVLMSPARGFCRREKKKNEYNRLIKGGYRCWASRSHFSIRTLNLYIYIDTPTPTYRYSAYSHRRVTPHPSQAKPEFAPHNIYNCTVLCTAVLLPKMLNISIFAFYALLSIFLLAPTSDAVAVRSQSRTQPQNSLVVSKNPVSGQYSKVDTYSFFTFVERQ